VRRVHEEIAIMTTDSERDDWLIDESLMETFPASDPTSPARPGSLLGMRYAVSSRVSERTHWTHAMMRPWVIGALLGGVVLGVLMAGRREKHLRFGKALVENPENG
jgi:hypothetical protein